MTDNRKKRKAGNVIRTVILLAAMVVFCFSAYKLVDIYMGYKQGSDEYSALGKYAALEDQQEPEIKDEPEETSGNDSSGDGVVLDTEISGTETASTAEKEGEDFIYETETEEDAKTGETIVQKKKLYYMKNPVDFMALQGINDDIVGWLKVGALDISYPVTQASDNDYYLHLTFELVQNAAGCIFVDYQNRPDFQDDNTIIYGHNMKDGSMFGTLKNFVQDGVYESDPYFWIYTPERIYKYEIFNCSTVGAVSNTYTLEFGSRKEFQNYMDKALMQSQVDSSKVKVKSSDKIVTLSTCTGDEETRFVVQGKLVRTYASR